MSKVVFLSFANSVYVPSLHRLEEQIKDCPLIDEFYFLTNKDLDREFLRDFHPYIYRRGYGYWKWKAYLCKKYFDKLQDDDTLIYSDVGCDYNASAVNRFAEYIEIVKTHASGILCFEDPYLERCMTKGDIFEYMIEGMTDPSISDTNQRWAGMFMIRKCSNTRSLIDKWEEINEKRFDLITDKASKTPNFPDFVENRHDQSIFSILSKQHGAFVFPPSELDKSNYSNVPFLPTRHKVRSFWTNIRRNLLLPYRYAVGLYLVKVKHFYFARHIAW